MKAINGDNVTTVCNNKEIEISKDILVNDMNNAAVFAKTEKLALTKVVKVMKEAKSTVFTVCFNAKVDEAALKQKLAALTANEFKNKRALVQELMAGEEKTLTGCLTKSEGKLGRSLIICHP